MLLRLAQLGSDASMFIGAGVVAVVLVAIAIFILDDE